MSKKDRNSMQELRMDLMGVFRSRRNQLRASGDEEEQEPQLTEEFMKKNLSTLAKQHGSMLVRQLATALIKAREKIKDEK